MPYSSSMVASEDASMTTRPWLPRSESSCATSARWWWYGASASVMRRRRGTSSDARAFHRQHDGRGQIAALAQRHSHLAQRPELRLQLDAFRDHARPDFRRKVDQCLQQASLDQVAV